MHQKMQEYLMCGAQEARGTRNEINLIRGIKVGKINNWKSVEAHLLCYLCSYCIYLFVCLLLFDSNTQFPPLKRKMFFLSFQRLAQLHTVRYLKTYCYLCMLIILADTPRQ